MMPLAYTLAVTLVGILFSVAVVLLEDRRNRTLVRRWAGQEGWTLVAAVPVPLPPRLILVRASSPVFRVRVMRDDRVFRDGLVILGPGFLLPTLRGTRVLWDGDEVTGGFPVIPLGRPLK